MVLTRDVLIIINSGNHRYYTNMGYKVYCGDEIYIPIELLSTGSQKKIICKCDSCGVEKEVIFKNYVKYGNKWLEYFCRKCSEPKRKQSLNLSCGVDYPYQNKEIRSKFKN